MGKRIVHASQFFLAKVYFSSLERHVIEVNAYGMYDVSIYIYGMDAIFGCLLASTALCQESRCILGGCIASAMGIGNIIWEV